MVHVSQLGQLGGGLGNSLVSDILTAISGVTGAIGTATKDGQTSGQASQPDANALAMQQALAAKAVADAKAKEESSKMWMYVGLGVGVLAIGGGLIYWSKHR